MTDIIAFPWLGATQFGYASLPMIGVTNDCNFPYKLRWESDCDLAQQLDAKNLLNSTITELFIDMEFEPIGHDEVVVGIRDDNGNIDEDYHSIYQRFGTRIVVDSVYYNYLKHIMLFERWYLENVSLATEWQILNPRVQIVEPGDDEFTIEISFNVDGYGIEVWNCCNGVIAEVPFEEDCEDPIDPGGNDCTAYNVTINESGGTLTASAIGQPPNCNDVFQWFFAPGDTGVFSPLGSGSNVSLGQYGKYKVIGACGGCSSEDVFYYLDPCAGLQIFLSYDGNSIDVNYSGCTDGGTPTIAWVHIDDLGAETPLPNTTFTIVPLTTGNYRATVTCGTCVDEKIIYVNVDSCAWTAQITDNGNDTLTASVSGCSGTPDIDWTIDRGDGEAPEQVLDTPTVPINGNGLYIATITCDGCVQNIQHLIIACGVADCENTISIAQIANDLIANISECNDTPFTIDWYQNTGNGYEFIGSGPTVPINGNGMYKAILTCGTCIVEDEILILDCDTCSVTADITQSGLDLTVNISGCTGASTIQWSYIDSNSGVETVLPDTTPTITGTNHGLYIATVNCDGCTAIAGFMFCGDDCGSPFDPGSGLPIEVC